VQHLHTPIAGTLGTPVHVLQLLERLHPTPAVAGTPTQTALEWINAHEASPRGWYAGPIGWFDRNGNGEFVVALRSALLTPDAAYVYAGAGIVAASDPYKEYQETELKMKTMLDALTQTLSAGTRR
jgi:isochorismate synthase EntC